MEDYAERFIEVPPAGVTNLDFASTIFTGLETQALLSCQEQTSGQSAALLAALLEAEQNFGAAVAVEKACQAAEAKARVAPWKLFLD